MWPTHDSAEALLQIYTLERQIGARTRDSPERTPQPNQQPQDRRMVPGCAPPADTLPERAESVAQGAFQVVVSLVFLRLRS